MCVCVCVCVCVCDLDVWFDAQVQLSGADMLLMMDADRNGRFVALECLLLECVRLLEWALLLTYYMLLIVVISRAFCSFFLGKKKKSPANHYY